MNFGNSCNEQIKKEVLEKIFGIRDINQGLIAQMITKGKSAGMNIGVTNIGQATINKLLNDIIPQFNRAGVEFYTKSKVSKSIATQLTTYAIRGRDILKESNNILNPQRDEEEMLQLRKSNVFTRWMARLRKSNVFIRGIANFRKAFAISKTESTTTSQEAIQATQTNLAEYEELMQKVLGYNLRENIIDSLIQEICPEGGYICFAPEVPSIMENDIAPTLEKLGIGDLIAKLEQRIIAEYEKIEEERLANCTSQADRDIYVPNFEKYRAEKGKADGIGEKGTGQFVISDEVIAITGNIGIEQGEV